MRDLWESFGECGCETVTARVFDFFYGRGNENFMLMKIFFYGKKCNFFYMHYAIFVRNAAFVRFVLFLSFIIV